MKYVISLCLLATLSAFSIARAQAYDKSCYYGITFEVSTNPSWGYGELVILQVEPNSPAEKSGIKKGDIIMEIDGQATYLRELNIISDWLYNNSNPTVEFSVRNINSYFRKYQLERNCVSLGSVSEKELSNVFSFYSLENTNQRKFSLPLNVDVNEDVDYSDYHSFDFYIDGEPTQLDTNITDMLSQILNSKGLQRDTTDPDIVIQTYYSYENNPLYSSTQAGRIEGLSTWRYDISTKKMIKLPIISPEEMGMDSIAQNITTLGISFYDRKHIDKTKLTQIWDCKIVDYTSSTYPFEDYLNTHIPLLMLEYPYSTDKDISNYVISYNKYNYTGIHFDINDLSIIIDVDNASPAYKAGIRPGYIIKKINNKTFTYSKDQLSSAYKQFISETMKYRNRETQFTSIDGYSDCMFWDPAYYSQIAKAFKKSDYLTNFAFLYNFEKYVNSNSNNTLTMELWDGTQNRIITVTPEIRQSVEVVSKR